MPGGTVLPGEPCDRAVLRELAEESGLSLERPRFVGLQYHDMAAYRPEIQERFVYALEAPPGLSAVLAPPGDARRPAARQVRVLLDPVRRRRGSDRPGRARCWRRRRSRRAPGGVRGGLPPPGAGVARRSLAGAASRGAAPGPICYCSCPFRDTFSAGVRAVPGPAELDGSAPDADFPPPLSASGSRRDPGAPAPRLPARRRRARARCARDRERHGRDADRTAGHCEPHAGTRAPRRPRARRRRPPPCRRPPRRPLGSALNPDDLRGFLYPVAAAASPATTGSCRTRPAPTATACTRASTGTRGRPARRSKRGTPVYAMYDGLVLACRPPLRRHHAGAGRRARRPGRRRRATATGDARHLPRPAGVGRSRAGDHHPLRPPRGRRPGDLLRARGAARGAARLHRRVRDSRVRDGPRHGGAPPRRGARGGELPGSGPPSRRGGAPSTSASSAPPPSSRGARCLLRADDAGGGPAVRSPGARS